MECPYCKTENPDDGFYCIKCGRKYGESNEILETGKKSETNQEKPLEEKKYRIISQLCLITVLLIIVSLCFRQLSETGHIDISNFFNKGTYTLGETFEISHVAFRFDETFADKKVYFSSFVGAETTTDDTIISGYSGIIENRSGTYVELYNLEAKVYYRNDSGNRLRATEPHIKFYSSMDLLTGESRAVLGPGEEVNVYIYASPYVGYYADELIITVKGNFKSNGIAKNYTVS